MRRGRRRAAGRACAAAAAGCAVLSLTVPVRAQDDGGPARPDVFRGAASALVASVEADRDALLPIDDALRFIALEGSSIYETDLQTARASLLFPGNGLILGPNLACSTFVGQFPPDFAPVLEACARYDYPLSIRADASNPTRATEGSLAIGAPTDPVSANAVTARAHAAPEGSTTYAAMEDLRVLGLPALGTIPLPLEELTLDPTVLSIESATSTTDQRIEQGSLVVHGEAALSGVHLLGGLVRIGAIHSTSRVTDDAAGTRTAEASIEVSDVTVAGVPAQITEDGLVLGSPSGAIGPLVQQLQTLLDQLLEALNVRIALLQTEEVTDDGTGQAVASAEGLLIEVAADADGLPTIPGPLGDLDPNGTYVGSIQLGSTAASGGATSFDVDVPDLTGTPPAFDGGVPSGGSDVTFDAAPVAVPAGQEVASPPVEESAPEQLARALTDPFGGRLGLLYLAFAFAVLSICLMPTLTVPARLPAPGS